VDLVDALQLVDLRHFTPEMLTPSSKHVFLLATYGMVWRCCWIATSSHSEFSGSPHGQCQEGCFFSLTFIVD
jgi:hypothetical protein